MKVAIITLPLHTNYGGLLQAYALRKTIRSLGHDVTVLDLKEKMPSPKGLHAPLKYAGRMFRKMLKGHDGPEVFREKRYAKELPILSANVLPFIKTYIDPMMIGSYSDVKEGEFDAFVVGSDQVWRPRFFCPVEDAFLAFAEGWDVRRVAYAASFGTDELEYEYVQLEVCSKLLEKFDGVSVREDSAVRLCEEWLDYEGAHHVLDPVMLIDSANYRIIAYGAKEHKAKGKIVTYILDRSDEKKHVIEFVSKVSGMDVHDCSVYPYVNDRPVEDRVAPALEEWLAAFADAEFIVTDSFHGCVLSILLHKRFIAIGNGHRGLARLKSLLCMFGLDMRLVHGIDPEDDGEFFFSEPDWDTVDRILEEKREDSMSFLRYALGEDKKSSV